MDTGWGVLVGGALSLAIGNDKAAVDAPQARHDTRPALAGGEQMPARDAA